MVVSILPRLPSDHNLYVLAEAAVTFLQQQQINRMQGHQQQQINGMQGPQQQQQINAMQGHHQQINAMQGHQQQQQQKKKKKKNVKQGQQKMKVKKTFPSDHNLCVLAEAAVALLQQQHINAMQGHHQQQPINAMQGQQKMKVKKTIKKTQKRPSPLKRRRVQLQQRGPEAWLLELVAEHGGIGPPTFLCAKKLTVSDTNRNLSRFAIPRNIAYDVLRPLMDDEEWKLVCNTGERIGGGGLRVQYHDGVGSVTLCFKLWQSNLMFVFNDGWKLVVQRNALRPDKDVIEVWCFRDYAMALHFAFCGLQRLCFRDYAMAQKK